MKTITKGYIAGLKPRSKRYDLYDDCLQTWVTPTGKVGFAFNTKKNGTRVRLPIATFPSNKIDDYQRNEVQSRYADFYIEHTSSIPTAIIQQRQLSNRGKLVSNLFDAYIVDHVPTLRPHSRYYYQRLLVATLAPLHNIPLASLSKQHLLEIRRSLNDRPAVQNNAMGVLRACLNWGVQHEYLEETPYKDMPKNVTTKRHRVLTPVEIAGLWEHLKPLHRFLLLCGQRVGEVIAMRWEDLEVGQEPEQEHNEPERYPSVRWTQPDNKTGVPHALVLPQFAVSQLPLPEGRGHVYKSPQTKVGYTTSRALGISFGKALDRSGIDHCTMHDLRRTALTNIARLMQSGEAAERVANHALGDVASRYNLYSFEALKGRALMRWSGYTQHLLAGGQFDEGGLPVWEGTVEWHDVHDKGLAGDIWELHQ